MLWLKYLIGYHKKNKTKFKKNSFTDKYNVDKLVYYEVYGDVGMAIYREKQIKNWRRDWKVELIEENNKEWRDLFYDFYNK